MNALGDSSGVAVVTLVRHLQVRVLEVSRGGCRLEAPRPLQPGTTGLLVVEVDGTRRCDDVRVARCELRPGSGESFSVGAELLPTRRLTARTVRMAVHLIAGGPPEDRGEKWESLRAARGAEGRCDERAETITGRAPPLAVVAEVEPRG